MSFNSPHKELKIYSYITIHLEFVSVLNNIQDYPNEKWPSFQINFCNVSYKYIYIIYTMIHTLSNYDLCQC